ncbi:MAG: class I SAM-dependent methyltransferase [Lachnospiraceae bacterium]|nr:class I SAM-dependent methyltransferase [Lachnospiraceae bacterium]
MLEKMNEFFNKRVDGYEEHQLNAIDGAHEFYPYSAACLPMQENAEVLDLGCGTGLELDFYFKHNTTANVMGIDLAENMLKVVKNKFYDKKLTTICGSYFDIPLGEECYDAIVSVESLHHFTKEQKSSLYKKVFQALKQGGYLILTDYFAETDELECFYRQELLRLKSEQGICDDEFYHYDTPLTKAHELQALNKSGFSFVKIMAEWGATATIKAIK